MNRTSKILLTTTLGLTLASVPSKALADSTGEDALKILGGVYIIEKVADHMNQKRDHRHNHRYNHHSHYHKYDGGYEKVKENLRRADYYQRKARLEYMKQKRLHDRAHDEMERVQECIEQRAYRC